MNTAHTNSTIITHITPALRARLDKHCKQGEVQIPYTTFVRMAIAEKLDREAKERSSNS